MSGRIRFLGTGGSMGIPAIGCECEVCTSDDPNNQRLRTSALLCVEGKQILIDAGPDFRQQALRYEIDDLDGLILTHAHYDHIGGLDELRVYYFKHRKALPCIGLTQTIGELRLRHAYLFKEPGAEQNVTAKFDFTEIGGRRGSASVAGVEFNYLTYQQGGIDVLGLRYGNFAYVTDIRDYDESIFDDLAGVETLVVSALRETPTHVHLSLEEGVEFGRRVGAKETWFIHMAHEVDHHKTNAALPEGFQLTYDGLTLDI